MEAHDSMIFIMAWELFVHVLTSDVTLWFLQSVRLLNLVGDQEMLPGIDHSGWELLDCRPGKIFQRPTPVFLPGEPQGWGEPGGLPSMESHRVGHDWSNAAVAAATRTFCSGHCSFKSVHENFSEKVLFIEEDSHFFVWIKGIVFFLMSTMFGIKISPKILSSKLTGYFQNRCLPLYIPIFLIKVAWWCFIF